MTRRAVFLYGSILMACLVSMTATAEDAGPKLIPKTADGVDDSRGAGWHPGLRFAGNMALGQSKNVPGTTDGVSIQLGYMINAGLGFLSRKKTNEWASSLDMALAYTRTPVVDAFVKSIDTINFKSTYLYHPERLPWLGPFVAFRLTAPMLPGYEVRADPTDVVRLDPDGDVIDADTDPVTRIDSGDKIDLTDAFAPLTLRESVGAFATPLDKPWLKTDIRLGFGAWETFVRGGFVVEDDESTDLYELRQMQDSVQIGPELGILLNGAFKEHLTYFVSALFMYPVYESTDTALEGIDLLNMEFDAGLGVKITKYVSIDYAFKAYKQPLIVNKWQVQNNILLTIAFEVPSPAPPPPACPPVPECPAAAATPPDTSPTNAAASPGTPPPSPSDAAATGGATTGEAAAEPPTSSDVEKDGAAAETTSAATGDNDAAPPASVGEKTEAAE